MAAPRYVLIPFPSYGHLNPLLQFAAMLVSQGAKVKFITTSNTLEQARETLLSLLAPPAYASLQHNFVFKALEVRDEQLTAGTGDVSVKIEAWIRFLMQRAEEISEAVADFIIPDNALVVTDFVLYTPLASSGVPVSSMFWPSSAANMLFHFFLGELLEKGYLPYDGSSKSCVIDSSAIPGMPELDVLEDVPYLLQNPETARLPGFQMKEQLLRAPKVYLNSFEIEEKAISVLRDVGVNVVAIGPLLLHNHGRIKQTKTTSSESLAWLETQEERSVIYVSFGSMAELSSEQLEQLAGGLEECGYAYFWSLRRDSIARLPQWFQSKRKSSSSKGVIVEWCDQLQVLKSSSVGAFLTHCGWNSVLESLACGVPMLGWPLVAEQNLNCKFVCDVWRIGKKVKRKGREPSSSDISRSIEDVMKNGEELRSNMAMWAAVSR